MASTYLSMCASSAAPGRALRFVPGRPIAEFSVGRRGIWQLTAPGVVDQHLWISFDGQCVRLRCAEQSPAVSVDGDPLPLDSKRIVRLPCRIELGEARLIVDDKVPPWSVLDAHALDRAASTAGEPKIVPHRMLVPGAFAAVPPGVAVAVVGTSSRVPSGWVPTPSQRTIEDANATAVMPLAVMLERGLIPSAQAPEPEDVPKRRRRTPEARRRGTSAVARAAAWLSGCVAALEPRRWMAAGQRHVVAWGLLVPMVSLLGYAVLPESPKGSAPSTSFEATAWAASDNASFPAAARSDDERKLEFARTAGPRPDLANARVTGNPARPEGLHANAPAQAEVALPAPDAPSGPTGERLAVDALAAGDKARALALYAALAKRSHGGATFAEAARILSMARLEANASGLSNYLHERPVGNVADGVAIHAR